jgi:hypothetical protein
MRKFKCIHGIEGDSVNIVLECNQRLANQIDNAMKALRSGCAWRKGDGYYVSECIAHDDVKHSHSATDEPETWKFCPYCGGSIPKPLFAAGDEDEIDWHG